MRKVLPLFGFTLAAAVGLPADPPQNAQAQSAKPQSTQPAPQSTNQEQQEQQRSTFDFRAPPGGFGAQHGEGGQFSSRSGAPSKTEKGARTGNDQQGSPSTGETPVNR